MMEKCGKTIIKKEIIDFKKEVCAWLAKNDIDLSKIKMRCERQKGGIVIVFTNQIEMKNVRRSKIGELDCWFCVKKPKKPNKVRVWNSVYFYKDYWKWYLHSRQKERRYLDLQEIKNADYSKVLKSYD